MIYSFTKSSYPVIRISQFISLFVVLLVLLSATRISAIPAPKTARAVKTTSLINIDGKLNETDWQLAPINTDFIQRDPTDGDLAKFKTEFRVLYNDDSIYVGLQAYDPEPKKITNRLSRRDHLPPGDYIGIAIDSYYDKITGFEFAINPAGVLIDAAIYDDGDREDSSWNAVWEGAAHVHEKGWSAEMRIPFSQLRFSEKQKQIWGFQAFRKVWRTQEHSFWTACPKKAAGWVSLFGVLTGLEDIEAKGRIEIVPYGLVGMEYDPSYRTDYHPELNVGSDFKYSISNNIMLSGTVNPDFGQVEADPSVVNLTPDETFFKEKRPFFLEGFDIFKFKLDSQEDLFYTRRIGGSLNGSLFDSDPNVRVPNNTTILEAVKLSGKTASGWSFGGLNAVTQKKSVDFKLNNKREINRVLEPFTSYSVLATHKELREGRSKISFVGTATNRKLENKYLDWLHDQAYSGGINLDHRFLDNHWLFRSRLYGSHVQGSAEAIDNTQRSSPHYFQRSDADHIHYDPTRTSLSGYGANYELMRIAGEHWRGALGGDLRSPGLETNDLGFQTGADYFCQWIWGQYRDDKPGNWARNWYVNVNGWNVWDYNGMLKSTGGNINTTVRYLNYWSSSFGIGYSNNSWSSTALRGGPSMRGVSPLWTWLTVNTDNRKPLFGTLENYFSWRSVNESYHLKSSSSITWQSKNRLQISLGPAYERNISDIQYVDTVINSEDQDQYIFGRLSQHTLSLTFRTSYTFMPNLSLQVYIQPFLSAGLFHDYKAITNPRAKLYNDRFKTLAIDQKAGADDILFVDIDQDGFVDFEFYDADFNVREFNANVVLRWEYNLGSTVFLVWSHSRKAELDQGQFRPARDMKQLLQRKSVHRVLLKFSYWFDS